MTDHPGPLPSERVQDGHRIGHVPLHGAVPIDHGWSEAALLVARHGQHRGELKRQIGQVFGQARAAVEEQGRRTATAYPAHDLATRNRGVEFPLARAFGHRGSIRVPWTKAGSRLR
jgi:hypothetical protein